MRRFGFELVVLLRMLSVDPPLHALVVVRAAELVAQREKTLVFLLVELSLAELELCCGDLSFLFSELGGDLPLLFGELVGNLPLLFGELVGNPGLAALVLQLRLESLSSDGAGGHPAPSRCRFRLAISYRWLTLCCPETSSGDRLFHFVQLNRGFGTMSGRMVMFSPKCPGQYTLSQYSGGFFFLLLVRLKER